MNNLEKFHSLEFTLDRTLIFKIMNEELFDIAIIGNGIIGNLAASVALEKGYKVAIIGPKEKKIRQDHADARAYAISPAANRLINFCGLSDAIDQESENIKKMEERY